MSTATPPTTLVVIVNYRTPALVIDCLRSLQPELESLPGSKVVVVDNCSGDGSSDRIAAAISENGWQHFAQLHCSEVNGGFSFGNNAAMRPALAGPNPPAYCWLLNPDTRVFPGALRELVDFMEARPKVGICGSSIEDDDGRPWPYAFRFPSLWSEFDQGLRLGIVSAMLKKYIVAREMGSEPARVDWLAGASMMVRREVFEQVGLMDEDYFLYYEETDFCLQAQRAGWEAWYVPKSRVMHISGQSTGVTSKESVGRRLPKYWFDSRRRYFMKNHGRAYAAATDVAWTVGFVLWRMRRVIQRKPDEDPKHMLSDLVTNSALLNGRLPVNPSRSKVGAA